LLLATGFPTKPICGTTSAANRERPTMEQTLAALIADLTSPRAIGAPGRPWLDGPGLAHLAATVAASLAERGIGPGDRVAIVLPNGPEMATAFITVAAACCAAPLNPAYKADEVEFYLSDLKPAAIILAQSNPQPAAGIAAKLNIPILTLIHAETDPAGLFHLEGATAAAATQPRAPSPSDPALVLHTSGTTARPKIVPLTNANITASAAHIARSLALTPADTCLNVMPLFHIHGLIAAVTASLSAGAAVCCTPGFNAFKFAELLRDIRPTWYTAVPTMHQAILMRMRAQTDQARAAKLRFIRSSSASLPPQVMAELEDVFGAPVIEAYGMTEAAHQMAANPLPPRTRKPGAVGIAAGPEIAIMDDAHTILPQGEIGEVVIRGPNVTPGYDNNPAANATAFTDGWFRTGDQGRLDEEGYLFLTGRLKEQINRGGEKISPLEVDVVLLDHPAIAQACTFGIPHDKLGEEVGAAIVLRPGTQATEAEIRDFAAIRLAPFKVPRRVLIMDDIPKGATGKIQRIGLAAKLGLAAAAEA
jgi:acyl-CoA synthetase (AMP-forming)/AMP-acid ligase II